MPQHSMVRHLAVIAYGSQLAAILKLRDALEFLEPVPYSLTPRAEAAVSADSRHTD